LINNGEVVERQGIGNSKICKLKASISSSANEEIN